MTDGFERFQAAEGGPVTAHIDGAEVVAEKVVLIRRYNNPSLHRPGCRHLKGVPVGTMSHSLIDVTDELRKQASYGYIRLCRTCKPLSTTGR